MLCRHSVFNSLVPLSESLVLYRLFGRVWCTSVRLALKKFAVYVPLNSEGVKPPVFPVNWQDVSTWDYISSIIFYMYGILEGGLGLFGIFAFQICCSPVLTCCVQV